MSDEIKSSTEITDGDKGKKVVDYAESSTEITDGDKGKKVVDYAESSTEITDGDKGKKVVGYAESSTEITDGNKGKKVVDYAESSRKVANEGALTETVNFEAIRDFFNDLNVSAAKIMRRISSYNIPLKESNYDLVVERLRHDRYNAYVCTTEWDAVRLLVHRYTARHTFIEILNIREYGGRQTKLVVDFDFRTQFTYYLAEWQYAKVSSYLPKIFVGTEERLERIIKITSSFAEGFVPHSVQENFLYKKWLSPYRTRKFSFP